MGNIILVSSHKREIGKSAVAIKMGFELTWKGKKTIIVDLSAGKTKIAEHLKLDEEIVYDVIDIIDELCDVEQSIVSIADDLYLLPAPRAIEKSEKIERRKLTKLLVKLSNEYDAVILDAESIENCYYIDYSKVNYAVLISNNDFSAVKELNDGVAILSAFGRADVQMMINRFDVKQAKNGMRMEEKDMKKLLNGHIVTIVNEKEDLINMNYDFFTNKAQNDFSDAINCIVSKFI